MNHPDRLEIETARTTGGIGIEDGVAQYIELTSVSDHVNDADCRNRIQVDVTCNHRSVVSQGIEIKGRPEACLVSASEPVK